MRVLRAAFGLRENTQVYICFDGPENQILQTSVETYQNFYRLLGWELMGPAAELPLFKEKGGEKQPIPLEAARRISEEWKDGNKGKGGPKVLHSRWPRTG